MMRSTNGDHKSFAPNECGLFEKKETNHAQVQVLRRDHPQRCVRLRCSAQDIKIDWASKSVLGAPTRLTKPAAITITVDQVNNIPYSYQVDVVAKPSGLGDINLGDLFPAEAKVEAKALDPASCDVLRTKLDRILKALTEKNGNFNPEVKDGYRSIPLVQTVAGWKQDVEPAFKDLEKSDLTSCPTTEHDYKAVRPILRLLKDAIEGKHDVEIAGTLQPCYDYTITVTEQYKGVQTKDGQKPFDIKLECNTLTLSAGTLLTSIQDRGYQSRKVPGQTLNSLAVEGGSRFRPVLLGMLNYQLPIPSWNDDTVGLALSAGPIFQPGGKSDVSTLGFFTGISLHLWHRVFITPGLHIGQFADSREQVTSMLRKSSGPGRCQQAKAAGDPGHGERNSPRPEVSLNLDELSSIVPPMELAIVEGSSWRLNPVFLICVSFCLRLSR
jgi:hypothetical protein